MGLLGVKGAGRENWRNVVERYKFPPRSERGTRI